MVLNRIYTKPTTLGRVLPRGLWSIVDGFAQWLLDRGRRFEAVRIDLWHVRFFTRYLDRRRIAEPSAITWPVVEAFLKEDLKEHGDTRRRLVRHRSVARVVGCFTEYLVATGLLAASVDPPPPFYQPILDEYLTWMKDYCHRSQATLVHRRRFIVPFLEWMGKDRLKPEGLPGLGPEILQRFILDYGRDKKAGHVAAVAMAVRGFCRFCLQRGYVDRDLTPAIPSFVQHKHSRLPATISEQDARKVLAGIDRTAPAGKRDYAIVQVLYTYGVRAGHICLLRLDDIEWPAAQIRFPSVKRGKRVVVPITDEVGDSLLDYLQNGRPRSDLQEVFLTVRPAGGMMSSVAVTTLVGRRLENAGVQLSPHGAGVFRHGLATRMLAAGHSLKSIADLLGHRNLTTTSIYTKVDFQTLATVALEWPEERS